jgi:hypothetical protein
VIRDVDAWHGVDVINGNGIQTESITQERSGLRMDNAKALPAAPSDVDRACA